MSDSLAARWEKYHEAGRRSFSQGHLAEAEQAFHAAVGEAELLGPESAQLATSLNALGQVRAQAKDYAAAEPFLTRALAIREHTFGTEGHALVPTLNALAALHDARAEYDRAESLLRRALAISEHHLGPAHPEVSVGLNNLAKLYFKRRDFAKADRLLLRLLEIKRAVGKDHPEVATVLGSLAKLRQTVGKHDQGEQLWRQALAIRERGFAPNDPVIATTLENLADCCAAIPGRVAEAITLRERALGIRQQTADANAPAIAGAQAKLSELRARTDSAVTPPPAPRRNSAELPSPIISQEGPALMRDDTPRSRPTSDLPWLDVEDSDRFASPLDSMMPPVSSPTPAAPLPPLLSTPILRTAAPSLPPLVNSPRLRTPAASVTPLGVPRQNNVASPSTFTPPMVPGGDLVLSDSIAPEPPARETTSGRAARYVAPTDSRSTMSGRGTRYVAPDPDSTAIAARPRTPRMPAEMARRGSSKRLIVVGMLFVLIAGAGWTQRARLTSATAEQFESRVKSIVPAVAIHVKPVLANNAPAATADASVRAPTATIDSARQHALRDSSARAADAATKAAAFNAAELAATAREDKRIAARDSARRVKRVADDNAALQLKQVPAAGGATDVEAVTNDVEQSTKSKVETAKPRVDDKPPIFKKP